jgi:16S rRNA A1518/A1519 N6-dimethyltransferase RsmA/KsgA/DIM1 with predicted DNA glycosylase/AP lyase activity
MSLAVNYLRWQFDLIRPFLGRRILEIGAGTGNLALRMAEIAEEIVCIEPNDSCHSELARRVGSVPWRRDSPHVC